VGFRDKRKHEKFNFPPEISLKTQIKDLIDFKNPQKRNFYYSNDNHGYYDKLSQEITQKNTIYQ